MTTHLFHLFPSPIEGAPVKAQNLGVLSQPLPFHIGNSDRLLIDNQPLIGLRSQFDIKQPDILLSTFKAEPRLLDELPLFGKALALARGDGSDGRHTFLFEILSKTNTWPENAFYRFNDVELFKPFKTPPSIRFIGDISHLPFVPGTNDIICPFTRGEAAGESTKPFWYCVAMRWHNLTVPNITLVFAYRLAEDTRVNGFMPSENDSVLLYRISRNEITDKLQKEPVGSIEHLNFIPGRADLFRPFYNDIADDECYYTDHRVWDAHHPQLTQVHASVTRIGAPTQILPITRSDKLLD